MAMPRPPSTYDGRTTTGKPIDAATSRASWRDVAVPVIELDALADPVRPAAEDDLLVAAVRVRLARRFVRTIDIRRDGFELRRAGVDALVDRRQTLRDARIADRVFLDVERQRELLVAETGALQAPQIGRLDFFEPRLHGVLAQRGDLDELPQEPRIDVRDLVQMLDGPAAADRAEHVPHAAVARNGQLLPQRAIVFVVHAGRTEQQAAAPELQRPDPLHERFLERAADRHRLADRLHLRRQRAIGLRELLEVPARNLDDDVVDRRLEGRGSEPRDVVRDLVQVVAKSELCGNLRDRETGGFRRERRRSRHARIHLDHGHSAVRRVHGELDVRSAGLDADLADDLARRVAHPLVFLVAEREDRRDGDAVAGVHAHRIDVLDRADDDEVVGSVAHHLELEFLPADHRFLDEDVVDRAELDAALREIAELFDVVGD